MSSITDDITTETNYSAWNLLRDIAALLRPYHGRFILASLIRLVSDLTNLYPAIALGTIVTFLSQYSPGQSARSLIPVLALWVAAIIGRALGQFYAKYFGYQVAERVALDASLNTVRHLFAVDMAWHERENSGNKLKRIQNANKGLNDIIRIWFNSLIEIAVNFIGITIVVYQFSREVSLVLLVFLVSYFAISFYLTRRAARAAYAVNVKEEGVTGLLFEAINNIRSVKVMGMARSLFFLVNRGVDELFSLIQIRIFRFQLRGAFLMFWGYIFRIGGIVVIIIGILNGRYELGFLVLFSSYFYTLWESVGELSDATQDFVVAQQAVARMNDILQVPITIDDDSGKKKFPKDWETISVKDLSFSYGDNEVLKNISFELRRGEKLGVVGLSGAGKSTLFKLLLKEYEDYQGEIYFDNVPLKQIKKLDYFHYASVVLQDTEVFNFSLKDNIAIVNPKQAANSRLFQESMTIAHVDDFLSKLPHGVDTLIGEKGVKLSGGEKQRLGIARAVFKQPQLLLLDEATSHLDLESEEKIRDSLHKFFENVTAIVIAHRLTTIREMDRILVIENGQLIEQGSFEELYKKQGRFHELWEKQKL